MTIIKDKLYILFFKKEEATIEHISRFVMW